jgi:hypothetical protein
MLVRQSKSPRRTDRASPARITEPRLHLPRLRDEISSRQREQSCCTESFARRFLFQWWPEGFQG